MISVQPAIPDQAGILTTITFAAKRHWNYPESWIQEWRKSLTITPEYMLTNETWAAIEGEKCVAYYSLKHEDEYLWLDNLWVLPEFIGQGIGKQLFQHALKRLRMRAVSILKIEAEPNAQIFYEKMGARKTGEHHTQVDGHLRILPIMEIEINSF